VGISAIHLPGSKPDMLDRSLIAKFSFIRKDFRRKYKEDILPAFYQLRPQLLGYIFDILSQALKIKSQGGVQLDTRSRMADWEELMRQLFSKVTLYSCSNLSVVSIISLKSGRGYSSACNTLTIPSRNSVMHTPKSDEPKLGSNPTDF
jgi:hypothetical protein